MEQSLARSPLLARIDRHDLPALLALAEERSFRAGQVLFQGGDAGDGLYAIVSGEVRVAIEGADGADVTIAMLARGDVLGELSVLDRAPRSATAVAATAVSALHVTNGRFQDWLATHPRAAGPMLAELAKRLRHTDEQLAELALLGVDARLARRLWQRFAEASENRGPAAGAVLRVNQRELASTLGITRESVNKHLARLKAQRIVAIDGGEVTLLEPRALQLLAEPP